MTNLKKVFAKKITSVFAGAMLAVMPFGALASNQNSVSNINTISGTVTQSNQGVLTVNQIIPVKTTGVADGTFENGWRYTFDITAPLNEQNLMMKFSDWRGFRGTMTVANNIRFFSSQSSNAFNENSAIYITSPNIYSRSMFLTGNLGGTTGRHIQITVEVRIPFDTANGSYSSDFGVQTLPTPIPLGSSGQNTANGNSNANSQIGSDMNQNGYNQNTNTRNNVSGY